MKPYRFSGVIDEIYVRVIAMESGWDRALLDPAGENSVLITHNAVSSSAMRFYTTE